MGRCQHAAAVVATLLVLANACQHATGAPRMQPASADQQALPGDAAAAAPAPLAVGSWPAPAAGAARMLLVQGSGGNSSSTSAAGHQTPPAAPICEAVAALVSSNTSSQLAVLEQVAAMAGQTLAPTDALTPAQLLEKRLVSRILLLLSDAAWIVYTVGLLVRAIFALLVPLVPIGRTGIITLDALSLLNWGQLVSEVVARLGDLLSKIFLLVSHAVAPV